MDLNEKHICRLYHSRPVQQAYHSYILYAYNLKSSTDSNGAFCLLRIQLFGSCACKMRRLNSIDTRRFELWSHHASRLRHDLTGDIQHVWNLIQMKEFKEIQREVKCIHRDTVYDRVDLVIHTLLKHRRGQNCWCLLKNTVSQKMLR